MVLLHLVKREIKVFLKNPAFIISIIVLIGFYGAMGEVARRGTEVAVQAVLAMNIGVVLEEDTPLVREVVNLLNGTVGGRVRIFSSLQEAVESVGLGIVIPKGFTENATNPHAPVAVASSIKVEATSQVGLQARLGLLNTVRSLLKYAVITAVNNLYGELYRDKDVEMASTVLFYGKSVSSNSLASFLNIISLVPLLAGIVIGLNASTAAQLVALEKAEKAFEMLLSQPIKRSRIVLAKIIGASVASLIFAAAYIAGIFLMVGGIMSIGQVAQQASQELNLLGFINEISSAFGVNVLQVLLATLGIAFLLGLYVSGALGIVLGSLSPDERIAGILTTPVVLIYMGVAFTFMFAEVKPSFEAALASGIIVVPIPYMYTLSVITGQAVYGIVSIATAAAFCVVLTLVATYLFNRDIVILGLRIGLRRR